MGHPGSLLGRGRVGLTPGAKKRAPYSCTSPNTGPQESTSRQLVKYQGIVPGTVSNRGDVSQLYFTLSSLRKGSPGSLCVCSRSLQATVWSTIHFFLSPIPPGTPAPGDRAAEPTGTHSSSASGSEGQDQQPPARFCSTRPSLHSCFLSYELDLTLC